MKPRLTVRLYPVEGDTRYARVRVWDSKEAMYRVLPLEREHLGSSTPVWRRVYTPRGGWTDGIFVDVNLCVEHLGSAVISHEMFHATMAWARRVGVQLDRLGADDSVNADEERVAHAHSTMLRELVDRLYAAHLY